MTKNAMITGVTGQDGAYLAKLLLGKGYEVYGTYRRSSSLNTWRMKYLDVHNKVNLVPLDLTDSASIYTAIKECEPDEFYNLAAQSHVGASFEHPSMTANTNGVAIVTILEAIRQINPKIRFYQASTSEMFGLGNIKTEGGITRNALNENSILQPASPYGAAKLYGYWITKIYRQAYKLFSSQGILFNHESPIRGMEFVTRKISNAVAKISLGLEKDVHMGNLTAMRDWGYAPEYVEAMWKMLQQDEPDDFVIATGESHSVEEFLDEAFKVVNLDWKDYTVVDKKDLRPLDVPYLLGDYSKAEIKLDWRPKTKFKELVNLMVKEDVQRWTAYQKGEHFPWDAPSYPDEARIITRTLKA